MPALEDKADLCSTFRKRLELFIPLDRDLLKEAIKLKSGGLESFENGFDDARGEQGETQDTAEIGFVYGYRRRLGTLISPKGVCDFGGVPRRKRPNLSPSAFSTPHFSRLKGGFATKAVGAVRFTA
jgi:hypothetical protein